MQQNQTNYQQRGQGLLGSIAPILGGFLGSSGGGSFLSSLLGLGSGSPVPQFSGAAGPFENPGSFASPGLFGGSGSAN